MQQKQYPFLDSDVSGIFDDLLKEGLSELPEMKCPNEAKLTEDPKYCKYRRLIGYAIHDCFIFKDKVMQLSQQGKITLEEDNAATNVIIESKDMMEGVGVLFDSSDQEDTHYKSIKVDDKSVLAIIFPNEDLQLRSEPHNWPLFVSCFTQ